MSLKLNILTPTQQNLMDTIIKNELPLTAAELVSNHGFPASYVSSALSGLADRGFLHRVGKTPPINGRAGHTLWTATPEVMAQIPEIIPEYTPVENEANADNTKDRILQFLASSTEPVRTSLIARAINKQTDLTMVRNVLLELVQTGRVVRVGFNDKTDFWIANELFNEMVITDRSVKIPLVEQTLRAPSFARQLVHIVEKHGPLRASVIAKMTGRTAADITVRLTQLHAAGKLNKTKMVGTRGKRYYWSNKTPA